MPRIALASIQQLPDILSNEHFTFDLGTIPGGQNNYNMTLKVMDAVISGFGNQSFSVQLAGYVRNFRGMKTYGQDHAITVVYVEDTAMNTYSNLRNWHEYIVGTDSGTSAGGISTYAIPTAYLTIYDQAGLVVDILTFYNLFIQDVQDVQVSGSNPGQPVVINVVFKFDYYESSLATSM